MQSTTPSHSKASTPKFVSLFCGCGGFDLGLIRAGFECIGAFDKDPVAVRTYNDNFSVKATIRDLSENHKVFSPLSPVDVVIAGSPCQGFSTIGKRRYKDPRNKLLIASGEIALILRSSVIAIENVPGMLSGSHKRYFNALCSLLIDNGYETYTHISNSHHHSVAQIRRRIFLIAWKTKKSLHLPPISEHRLDLQDVIGQLDGKSRHDTKPHIPPLTRNIINKIGPGQKLCNVRGGPRSVHTWHIPEVFGETTTNEQTILIQILKLRRKHRVRRNGDADPVLPSMITKAMQMDCSDELESLVCKGYLRRIGRRYDLTHAFNGKFRRLLWDKPSYTVDTRFTDPRYFLHPEQNRGFTIREASRIQGFPDSFTFKGTGRENARLIGNAVPPPVAQWIGELIMGLLHRTKDGDQ